MCLPAEHHILADLQMVSGGSPALGRCTVYGAQIITYSLICKWFRATVLPLDAGLCAALLHRADRKKCVLCGGYYLSKSNRAKYCHDCSIHMKRAKATERKRKQRQNCHALGLKKP